MFTVLLAACSSSPTTNPVALAQLGKLTAKTDGSMTPTIGVATSASFEQIQAVSQKMGNAFRTAAIDPNSPEALDRAERINRGELEESTDIAEQTIPANSLHSATIDNCPTANQDSSKMTLSAIPMGISECEMVSLRGKPHAVRKLSLPSEQRRVLLSFKTSEGEMMYEFVGNRLATIY